MFATSPSNVIIGIPQTYLVAGGNFPNLFPSRSQFLSDFGGYIYRLRYRHNFSRKNELVSPRRLKQLIIQLKVLNINCYSFSHLFYTQSKQLNIRITHSHRYNSADLQIANKTIIEAFKNYDT